MYLAAVHDESKYVPKAAIVLVRTVCVGQAWKVVWVPGVYSDLVSDHNNLDHDTDTLVANLVAEANKPTQIAQ